jgi:hypothetical protein
MPDQAPNAEIHSGREHDVRRDWITPEVNCITAGSAEDGGGPTPDGGQPS